MICDDKNIFENQRVTLFSFFSSNYDERKMKSSEHNLYNSVANTTAPPSGRFYEPRPTYRSTEVDDVTIYKLYTIYTLYIIHINYLSGKIPKNQWTLNKECE